MQKHQKIRTLNRKTNITWHQSDSEISRIGLEVDLRDKKNYMSFLHLLFSTFQMQAQIGFFVEWPNEHKRMKNWERGCIIYFKELYSDTALLF